MTADIVLTMVAKHSAKPASGGDHYGPPGIRSESFSRGVAIAIGEVGLSATCRCGIYRKTRKALLKLASPWDLVMCTITQVPFL